ncbi:MAG: hypothetical protein ABS83_03645 [Rhodospirillales bacterium SCN 65-16]|nr:MAG: hypothetical protein ABS83_03645 [Rhodospirillales bacterium SCN 65-16]
MPDPFDWDDARILLALARAGSSAAAAAALGISAPTVGRRLRALERAVGRSLVDYDDGQLVLTAAGRRLIAAAERMELAASALEQAAKVEPGMPATVRVTAIPAIAQFLLHRLGDFLSSSDAPSIKFIVTSQALSLPRGEADIALRMGRLPRADGLRCRRLAVINYALYRRSGSPASASALLNDAPTVATHGHQVSAQAAWVDREAGRTGAPIRLRISDPALRQEACVMGLGTALLPCLWGDANQLLERVGSPVARLSERLFLLARPDTLARPEVRSVADAIAATLRAG